MSMTKEQLKAHLGIPEAATGRDLRIAQIVEVVNDYVSERTGRKFSDGGQYVERYRGNGSATLVLNRYPITELISIDEDGTALDVSDRDVVEVEKEDGMLVRTDGGHWLGGPKRIYTITYRAETAMPGYLRLAALEIGAHLFRGGGHQASPTGGGFSRQALEMAIDTIPGARSSLELASDSGRGFLMGVDGS